MATSRFNRRVLAASVAALLAPLTTFAATLYWDGGAVDILTTGDGLSQGGTGTWNTVLQNWDQTPAGSVHLAWPNTTADEAVFGGVAGTVSLGVPITANRLTFDVGGYTIDNGGTAANTLTLGGITPTITVTNAPDSATISAIIAGSADLTKAGNGTLVLSGTNTYSGATTISAGTLSVGADLNLGAVPGAATPGSLTLSGGTLATTASFTLATNRGIALGVGGGTINVGTGFTTVYGGVIAGGNSLTKAGSGTLTLSGVNTFTGGLAVNAGLVSVTAVGNLGAGAISLNGGTLRTTETAQLTFGAANIITVGASGGTLDNTVAFKLLINTAGGLTGSGTLTRTASANNVLVGTSNVLQISAANTGFTGAVILNGGQNEIATNGFGTGLTAGNTITVNSGAELTASAGTISNPLTLNTGANIGGDNGTSTFAGAITVNGNFNVRLGDFFQATNRNLIISGGLTGTGAITLLAANTATVPTVGAGQTLFLNGNNSGYTSNINFVAGFNVAFGAANSFGTGTVTINSTAAALGGIGFGYDFGAVVPTFANNRTGTTTGGIFGINTTLAVTTLNLATLGGGGMFLGSQSAGTYAATTLTPDGTTYRLGGGLGVLTFSGTNVLTGATSLIAGDTRANGTGTVVLGAANDYTGATTINGGTTLQINNGGALGGTATGTTVNAGGSLALSGGITVNEPLTITGTSATASVTNLVNGLVNVSGTNTYAGQINATTGASNARVNVAAGILNLSGNIILSGGGTATGFVLAGTGTINQTGVISGNGSVIATSSGTINPSALNTYTGAMTFQNGSGTYNVQSFNSVNGGTPLLASSSLGAPTTVAAGTLQFGSTTTAGGLAYIGTGETTDRVINLAGTTGNATITNSGTGLLKFTSNLTATGAGSKTFILQGSTAGTGEIAGVILNNSVANVTNLTKSGTGTWTLSGLNTYTGTTTINGGNLIISTLTAVSGAASSLGSPTTVATGTIGMGATTGTGTLTYVGIGSTSDRVINLAGTTGGATIDMSGTGTFQVGAVTATGAGIKTLTLTGSTAGLGVIGGAIADNTATNKTSVTKTGTGTWNLQGVNTYTGATTINAGLLRINGSTTSGSAVAVNASAYLGGTGTVGGAVTVAANGGIDLRDGVIGTLTLGSTLALNGAATTQNSLAFDLGSSTVDNIVATGAVTAATASSALITFNQLAGTPLANGTYTLISSAATSVPTGFALATTQSGGHTYALTTATTGNILQVTVGTAATGPAAAVWGGTASTAWTAAGNWNTDATSNIAAGASPGVGTNVSFNTTTPVAGNLSTALGADFEINSLTFLSTATTPITIAGATNALTIDAGTANGNVAGNGISQLAAATHTISSRVGLGAAQTWTVAAGGGLTISGLVFDVGTGFTLTKAGAGTLTLSGTANTFTGDIAVTAGILAFAGNSGTNGDPLSLGAGTKTITITNNATIRPTSNANPTGTNTKRFVVGTGGATFDAPTGVTFTLDDATQFSGTGDLTVTGAGTGAVYLNNQAFNFTGNVIVNSGTLRLGTNSVLGTATGRTITVNAGGTLDANNTVTAANVPLGIILNGGTLSATTANGSFAQVVTLTANSSVSAGSAFTETVSGNITGAFSLTKAGPGITVLSGTNSYVASSGASTIVSAGILQAAKTVSLPNYATAGQVTVASGTTLALNVGGAGEFTAADVTTILGNGTFVTGSGIGFDTTNAGGSFTAPAIAPAPTVAALNLTKLGNGILALANTNAFGTGSTTIFNGTVSVTSGANNSLGTGALILGTNAGVPGNLDLGTTSQTVSTVTARSNSATANTITIGAGQTLTATGAVTIGLDTGASPTTNLTVTGATGTFSIGTVATPTNANVQLGSNATTNVSNGTTLDLSGVGTFYANLGTGTLRVGDASNSGGTASLGSSLILAPTTTIRATTITSDSPDGGVTQSIKLGSISNILNANTIEIGGSSGGRSTGLLNFNTTTGTLTVRNLAGTGRAAMNVAYGVTATGFVFSSTVDLTGHSADLFLSTLNIAGRTGSTGGATTASFSFDSGTLDATGVTVGNRGGTATTATGAVTGTLNLAGGTVAIGASGLTIATNTSTVSPGTNNVVGTVTISGAAVTVAGPITLGNATTAAELATANLNITGGSLTMGGNIVKGTTTGTVTSSLTLNGANALLDLGGKNIGAAGAGAINNLTFAAGTLQNVNLINGTGGVTKSGAGTLTLAGTNAYTGGTDVATGTVLVTGSILGNVNVSANATLGGTGTVLTGATGKINVLADGSIAPGANGIGTLTVDAASTVSPAISLTSGADFTFELNTGLVSDRLALVNASVNSIAFTGNTINFSDLSVGALSEGNYTLFTANIAGAYSGLTTDGNGFITSGLVIGSGLGAYGGSSLQVLNNNIVLVVVPEPASAAVLLAGLSSLLGLGRFRRRA